MLIAISNARYVITLVDIGSYGSANDSGVFRNSTMGKGTLKNRMILSDLEVTSNDCSRNELPCYFVGDKASPLET